MDTVRTTQTDQGDNILHQGRIHQGPGRTKCRNGGQTNLPGRFYQVCYRRMFFLYFFFLFYYQWMTDLWSVDRDCYVRRHGINPADDCTILIFFSEVN